MLENNEIIKINLKAKKSVEIELSKLKDLDNLIDFHTLARKIDPASLTPNFINNYIKTNKSPKFTEKVKELFYTRSSNLDTIKQFEKDYPEKLLSKTAFKDNKYLPHNSIILENNETNNNLSVEFVNYYKKYFDFSITREFNNLDQDTIAWFLINTDSKIIQMNQYFKGIYTNENLSIEFLKENFSDYISVFIKNLTDDQHSYNKPSFPSDNFIEAFKDEFTSNNCWSNLLSIMPLSKMKRSFYDKYSKYFNQELIYTNVKISKGIMNRIIKFRKV